MFTTPFLVLALLATPQQLDSAKNPQTKPAVAAPTEFEKSLTATTYRWSKDKDGDYKVELNWDDEKRSQLVFLRGVLSEIKAGEAPVTSKREIWSICWKGTAQPDADKLVKLLTTHYKLGGFQIEKTDAGKWTAYYRIDVPDAVQPAFLRQAIRISAEAADEMEKALTGTDDF